MRRAAIARTSILLIPFLALAAGVSPDLYIAHVRYLASPELKGQIGRAHV